MDYGEVLTKAWHITWRRKSLWVLGLLAGCSASGRGSGGGQAGSGFRGYNFNGGQPPGFEGLENVPPEVWVSLIIGIILVVLALALISLVLGVLGQSGLIAAFAQEDAGVEIPLAQAFSLGGNYFWRLLGVRFVVWLVSVLLFGSLAIFAIFTLGIGLICLAPLLCLLIPLSFLIDAYVVLTMVAAVQEDLGVLAAFSRTWEIVRAEIGPVLVMALILILGGGIINLIITAPFIAVFLPGIAGLAVGEGWSVISGLVASGALLLIALPLLLLASAIITTFTTGAWTITYRRLVGEGGEPLESGA